MAIRTPSLDELSTITRALRHFLETVETYALFLSDTSSSSVMARWAATESLQELEKSLNPKRLPFSAELRGGMCVAHWPYPVMQGIIVLVKCPYDLIEEWDVPEICHDGVMMRARFSINDVDADGKPTEKLIDRPSRLCILPEDTRNRLKWCLGAFEWAVDEARGDDPAAESDVEADAEPPPQASKPRRITNQEANLAAARYVASAKTPNYRGCHEYIIKECGGPFAEGRVTGYPGILRRRKLLQAQEARRAHRRRSMPRCVSPTRPT